ncbi:MAG: hypothetical protein OXG39_14950 [Chloroflexi bacterium]|nr:hypothetical protein [Chloroflexota bacterium]
MTSISRNLPQQDQELESARRLRQAYELLDDLHSAICEDRWRRLAVFESRAQLISWLKEVSYIAQESINELEAHRTRATPELRILEKPVVTVPEERAE